MTKLDVLLNELCPDGVPFKRLEECCSLEKGNTPIQKAIPGEYPLVVTTNERKSSNTFQFDQPSVCVPLVSSRGHGVACLNQVYYQEGRFALGNILCAVTPLTESELSAKFLYYYLNLKKDTLIVPLMKGGANVSLTVNSLKRVKVAIPPLLVQDEIVQRLQSFEALLNALSEELSARRKQYEYYRNQLLTFSNGTKKMPLSDVANVFRGEYITQKGSKTGEIPVILGGQEPAYYIDKANHEGEIVVIARSGVSAGFVSYWNQPIYVTDGFGYEAREGVAIPKYLYYALKRREVELNAMKRGAGVPHVSGEMLGKIELSIPSIPVQERLVKLLDNFEAICSDLNIGLPAEIEARQKQYEYYRDLLLTFAETGMTIARQTDRQTDRQAEITLLLYVFGYVYLPLGETCLMKAGKAIQAVELSESKDENHAYECYGGNGIRGYIGKTNYHGGFPIIGRQGALCGNVQYADGDFYATEHAVVVLSKGLYDQRYLYYLLTAMNLNQYRSAGAQPGLAVGKLETIVTIVPSMEQQLKTVSILDRFDKLCNDLSSGLPAEIEARQKQYEYYRDKLLTFDARI